MQPVVVEEHAVAQVGYANGPDQVERKLAEFSQVIPDWKQFRFAIISSFFRIVPNFHEVFSFFDGIKKKDR